MRWTLLFALSVFAVFAFVAIGCEDDEIRTYRVQEIGHEEAESSSAPSAPASAETPMSGPMMGPPGGRTADETRGPRRMLAAIVPHGRRVWFFKLTGQAEAVGEQDAAFDGFIRSLSFENGEPQWKLPEGWHEADQAGGGMRHATLHIQGSGIQGHLNLTVIPLGQAAGKVLPNVNRWRGQLGLEPIQADSLDETTRNVRVAGQQATMVNMTGPGGGSGGMGGGTSPPFASPGSQPPPTQAKPMPGVTPGGQLDEDATGEIQGGSDG